MRHVAIIAACLCLLTACADKEKQKPRHEVEPIDVEILLRSTPVKDQGSSQMCWLYAMLATIETEHIMRGDSIDLSPTYLVRQVLADKAHTLYANQCRQPIHLRGMITMVPRLLDLYGAVPFTSYRGYEHIDYPSLVVQLQRATEQCVAHRTGIKALDKDIDQILENTIGPAPSWVFMYGSQYTPREFAHSICRKDEYLALTSFTHHPFGAPFVLEVPDNLYHDSFLNVPLDSMMTYIERALRTGHPVCWEGDVSEKGFDEDKGFARLPDGHAPVTQQSRQQAFDHGQTTDDHSMAIVGIARDKTGRKYYVCKNSWGRKGYKGHVMMEEDYMRAKTIAVMVPAAALPSADVLIPPQEEDPIPDFDLSSLD